MRSTLAPASSGAQNPNRTPYRSCMVLQALAIALPVYLTALPVRLRLSNDLSGSTHDSRSWRFATPSSFSTRITSSVPRSRALLHSRANRAWSFFTSMPSSMMSFLVSTATLAGRW